MDSTGKYKRRTIPQSQCLVFVNFCNQLGSKTRVLEVLRLVWDRALRALPYSWREGTQEALGEITQSEGHLRHERRDCSLFLEHICERANCLPRERRTDRHHFLPMPFSIGAETISEGD